MDTMNDESEEGEVELPNSSWRLLLLGLTFVSIGIAVIVIATLLVGGFGSVGGVILIGPIPIVFGSGPESSWLIALGIALTVVSVVVFLVLNRRARKENG